MPKGKKHTPEHIVAILRRADQGQTAWAVSGQRRRLRKHTGDRRAVAPDFAPAPPEAKAKRRGAKARRWGVERAHSWLNRFRRLLVP